jgi:hypothetical protein
MDVFAGTFEPLVIFIINRLCVKTRKDLDLDLDLDLDPTIYF